MNWEEKIKQIHFLGHYHPHIISDSEVKILVHSDGYIIDPWPQEISDQTNYNVFVVVVVVTTVI